MYLLQVTSPTDTGAFWLKILIAMIGSGFASSLITFYSSKKLLTTGFIYDYRKYILDKRKEAYGKIEDLIVLLDHLDIYSKYRETNFNAEKIMNDLQPYTKALHAIDNHVIWISEAAIRRMNSIGFHVSFFENFTENDFNKNPRGLSKAILEFHLDNSELKKIYFEDILKLGNIDLFRKGKKDHINYMIEVFRRNLDKISEKQE